MFLLVMSLFSSREQNELLDMDIIEEDLTTIEFEGSDLIDMSLLD